MIYGVARDIHEEYNALMRYRTRRVAAIVLLVLGLVAWLVSSYDGSTTPTSVVTPAASSTGSQSALDALGTLAVKGRAPKTGYARTQFGDGWATTQGCDTRNIILNRDLTQVVASDCKVMSGLLADPYTGKTIEFVRGTDTSDDIQIDHVVARSNAWQTGAQQLSEEQRKALANDPLELLAVDGPTNQAKGDGDAATWLPPNKAFRCQYVARQVAVKAKYSLWVTSAEKDAIARVLGTCPAQPLPSA